MARKTTLYLPDDVKAAVEAEAARTGLSEAEVMRRAIAAGVSRPKPRARIFSAEPFAERVGDLLAGFGER